ncbi:hypothetical protein, partial [Shigella flexneri]|uniref:hypothetical protein n=1 Tax=Shigella flexneri TaxID=623 RepID=UPI001C0A92A6
RPLNKTKGCLIANFATVPNLLYHRLSLLAAQILAMAFQEVRAIRMALESLVKELSREHR